MHGNFLPLVIKHGLLRDATGLCVQGFSGAVLQLAAGNGYFGMVTAGTPTLAMGPDHFKLRCGMYFATSQAISLSGGQGIVISLQHYQALRQFGGPLEAHGRLRYIDGCTDTLLISPPRLGEPCLNHLHIPAHTNQTEHTHPSVRIGVIVSGSGECVTPERTYPLFAGMAWWIPAGTRHAFRTRDLALDVIAWHPDSDFGPTDEVHPMKNRTLL